MSFHRMTTDQMLATGLVTLAVSDDSRYTYMSAYDDGTMYGDDVQSLVALAHERATSTARGIFPLLAARHASGGSRVI